MDEATSCLFGLDRFRVIDVARVDDGVVQVVIETVAVQQECPDCGVCTGRVKERPPVRIKDLPLAGQQTVVWWRKRRLVCGNPGCARSSFTRTSAQIPPRSRLTARLRAGLARSIAGSNRAVCEVAKEHRVAWHTAHRALVAAAARWLPEPTPTRVLGIDETRARRVRWLWEEHGWRRSDPWMTSFVDADNSGAGVLLGLAPGRSGSCVRTWLAEQSHEFRDTIRTVIIDPSAPYAAGIRDALPHARSSPSTSGTW